jgi:hypothetical protein
MVTELIRKEVEELGASARKRKETPPRPARTLKANWVAQRLEAKHESLMADFKLVKAKVK